MQAITRREARREVVMMLRVVRGVNLSGFDEWFVRDIFIHVISRLGLIRRMWDIPCLVRIL
jgi:hypothetical protein